MVRRRSQGAVCDSLLCTAAVAVPLALSLAYYRHDLRQLLRMLFLVAVLFGALLVLRHSLGRARRRLSKWLWSETRERASDVQEERPDLDRARDKALARAQKIHDQKAEDYEARVAGPRRERRLEETEKKARYLRGFGANEGRTLGSSPSRRSHNVRPTTAQNVGGATGTHEQAAGSHDGHVTSDDVIDSERTGQHVRVAVQLPRVTVQGQFQTWQTVETLYQWLEREGHSTQGHVLVTPHPRQLLDDRGRTLEECGITMDTKLILEETED